MRLDRSALLVILLATLTLALAFVPQPARAQDAATLLSGGALSGEESADATEEAAPAPALPAGADLASPRATFTTFLDAMNDYKESRDAADRERAIACFDLSGAESLRAQVGWKTARDLKNYLDRVEVVDLESIPDALDADRWTYSAGPYGEVSFARMSSGRWLFSAETVRSVDALFDSVRTKQTVEGLEGGGGAPEEVADLIRARMPETMLKRPFLLENWQWFGLLIIAMLGVVVERVLAAFVIRWLRKLFDRTPASVLPISGDAVANFQRPLGILAMTIVWTLLIGLLDLPQAPYKVLAIAIRLVMGISGVWAVYKLADVIAELLARKAAKTETKLDDLLIPLFRRAIKIAVIAFGVVFVAQNLNVDVTSLIAGLSIGGIAFALAAKDTVENLFGSVTVLIDRPFQIGDWIQIGDIDGTVVEVGLRSTRVRTFYNSLITVPNSRLVNAAVDNYGAREYRRIKCNISLQYDTRADTIEAFCEGVRELIRLHPYTRKDYYMVYFNQFAGSSLDVLLYCFVKTPNWPTELRERHRLFLDIVRLAHRLGVEFAFPTQTLHLASVPHGFPQGPGTPPGEQAMPAGVDDAVTLGRKEAEAIMKDSWGDETQLSFDVSRPDDMPPR